MSEADDFPSFEVFGVRGNPTPEEEAALLEALDEFLGRDRQGRVMGNPTRFNASNVCEFQAKKPPPANPTESCTSPPPASPLARPSRTSARPFAHRQRRSSTPNTMISGKPNSSAHTCA